MMSSKPKAVTARLIGLFIVVGILVCLPFLIFGQDFALPWLESHQDKTVMLMLLAIGLLAADSVAPIPSTLVIMFLAAKAGVVVGIVGSTIGLTLGVLTSIWFGRVAVGRVAPKFIPEDELKRLRGGVQNRLSLTLACWRAVPVMAEASVITAAAAGVPTGKIFVATLLPNLVVAVIYSAAADDSVLTATLVFFATLAASIALWWLVARTRQLQKPPALDEPANRL